jgi:transcriptional regulator with XRE-family HTH domain
MADRLLTSFGRRIASLRRERGLSQEDLADRSGLHRTYVGGVERGERNLGLRNVSALASALGVPLPELFTGVRK